MEDLIHTLQASQWHTHTHWCHMKRSHLLYEKHRGSSALLCTDSDAQTWNRDRCKTIWFSLDTSIGPLLTQNCCRILLKLNAWSYCPEFTLKHVLVKEDRAGRCNYLQYSQLEMCTVYLRWVIYYTHRNTAELCTETILPDTLYHLFYNTLHKLCKLPY